MSKVIKFSKHFTLGANKESGIKDIKNRNKIKKAIDKVSDEWITGLLVKEEETYFVVRLPHYNSETVMISKKAVKQEVKQEND